MNWRWLGISLILLSFTQLSSSEDESKAKVTDGKVPVGQEAHNMSSIAEPTKQNVISNVKSLPAPPTSVSNDTILKSHPDNAINTSNRLKTTTAQQPESSDRKPELSDESVNRRPEGREGVRDQRRNETLNEKTEPSPKITTAASITQAKPIVATQKVPNVVPTSGPTITKPAVDNINKTAVSTPITSTSTSTTTIKTTTTTTTTPKPKKPTITVSMEDDPSILNITRGKLHDRIPSSGKLDVEEPEQPIAQPSLDSLHPYRRDYFVSVVAIIFAVPIVMGAIIVIVRRFKDYWSTRHYRRMDFLVDGMYND